jgi:uncharacterized protein (TIGR03382 family)
MRSRALGLALFAMFFGGYFYAGAVGCGPLPEGATSGTQQRASLDTQCSPPMLVKDIDPRPQSAGPDAGTGIPGRMAAVNRELFFVGSDGTSGMELWRSDGGPDGTVRVRDLRPGAQGSDINHLTPGHGGLYFAATDGTRGVELWHTDGTEQGTVMVHDIQPGAANSGPEQLAVVGNRLFFSANDGIHGQELWKYERSDGGVVMLRDILPGVNGGSISAMTPLGNNVVFRADNITHGEELWVSNGTASGTGMVRDIWVTPRNGASPNFLAVMNGRLYFNADDGPLGRELWTSDGTFDGTTRVKDIWPGFADSVPAGLAVARNRLFFSANDGVHGNELWTSDGTELGTRLVKDIRPGTNNEGLEKLVSAGRRVFFESFDNATGAELWVSDGSDAGTMMVKDIFPGDGGSHLSNMRGVGQTLYFSAHDGVSGHELWKSDGTPQGTVQVMDIAPGADSSEPRGLVRVGMKLFFAARSPDVGDALWAIELCDLEPPLLSCPTDLEFEATRLAGTPVTYEVSATDDLTEVPQLEFSHPSGSAFPVGVTPVTVQARDEAGNVATCTFQVTLRDSAPPSITCPRSLTVSATSAEGAVVDYPEVRVVDTASPVTLVYEPPEGTLFPAGDSTRVRVTATDGSGNQATCQFTVSVEALPTEEESGCGCGSHPGGALGWGALGVLLALSRRRRAAGSG